MNFKKYSRFIVAIVILMVFTTGCVTTEPQVKVMKMETPDVSLTRIDQIDSFKAGAASRQALEVINNNPYSQKFFENVFEKLVAQCKNSASPENANLIWDSFVIPLRKTGKVPPDLVKNRWNGYFSNQFVSLPSTEKVNQCCYQLSSIKRNLEKEFMLKQLGFEACRQGSPETHFLNAMYVYNTIWAACKGTK